MARPKAKELTERELEIMQVFWKHGEMTAVEARRSIGRGGARSGLYDDRHVGADSGREEFFEADAGG